VAMVQGRSGVMRGGGFLTGGGGVTATTGEEVVRCWYSCFSSSGGPLDSSKSMKGRWR
jgi:hypothetical protein